MGKLTRKLFALACVAGSAALLVLPAGAQTEHGTNPIVTLSLQIILMLAFVFVVLLLTKRISGWIDRIREKRKK
ncbi:MAG: hypothetical protein FWE19_05770 [Oscillospiraceae bacterium]|nr:hypothetical protein [Oscillospiraceae bacterium]